MIFVNNNFFEQLEPNTSISTEMKVYNEFM